MTRGNLCELGEDTNFQVSLIQQKFSTTMSISMVNTLIRDHVILLSTDGI